MVHPLNYSPVDQATGGAVLTTRRRTAQILSLTVVFRCSAAVISSDPHGVNKTAVVDLKDTRRLSRGNRNANCWLCRPENDVFFAPRAMSADV